MKHLILASPRAKAALQGSFRESIPHTTDGLRHWQFEPMFNPKAFEIVLDIIHAQFHKVPEEMTVEMLANIAVVVDDLNCRNSVSFFAKLWYSKLKDGLCHEICSNLVRIIFISSVLGLSEVFKESTRIAIYYSPDLIPAYGFPIASEILGLQSPHDINYI